MRRFLVRRGVLLLLLPNAAILALFLVQPALGLLEISLRERSPIALAGEALTLANYTRLLDPYYGEILLRTVLLALGATMIGTVLAYPIAYVLCRSAARTRVVLSCVVMIPLMTSIVVKTFGWYILLQRSGPIASLIEGLGGARQSLLGNDAAVLLGLAEFSLPFMVFSLVASIDRIPVAFEEAASNLGAGRAGVFYRVILPLSRPGLVSGFLLCFGVSASAYVVPAVMGSQSDRMAAQQVFDEVMVVFNWPGAAALSMTLLLILGAVLWSVLTIGGRPRT